MTGLRRRPTTIARRVMTDALQSTRAKKRAIRCPLTGRLLRLTWLVALACSASLLTSCATTDADRDAVIARDAKRNATGDSGELSPPLQVLDFLARFAPQHASF